MPNDQQLILRFLSKRNESAFKTLYQLHTPRLYAIALRISNNSSDAEELIQQMWLIAIQKLSDFEGRSSFRTWLTGILINLNRDRYRHEYKHTEMEEFAEYEAHSIDQITVSSIDVENAIKHLPVGYRQILILHDVEGYKHREIAALLNISEGTSKSQLYHARKAMRQYFYETPQTEEHDKNE